MLSEEKRSIRLQAVMSFLLFLGFTKTDLSTATCVTFAWINGFKENTSAEQILDTMSAAFAWR